MKHSTTWDELGEVSDFRKVKFTYYQKDSKHIEQKCNLLKNISYGRFCFKNVLLEIV